MMGAFYQSGQSCIGVQRVLIHESIYEGFKAKLAKAASKLPAGDPLDENTFLGPLITEQDAIRIETWVNEAVEHGARVVCGGRRHGAIYEATFLENVDDSAKVACEEAFGPVATLEPFDAFDKACERVNQSEFGLQAGVFTRNLNSAYYAFNELDVGGVVINDVPSFRVDSMPYGGVKDSGLGREGMRYAIADMTEIRLMVLNRVGHTPR
jgi:acyl-CoA reductase-like NAD-dependent aldehyde dehydrogenase